ncbi:MAG: ATP-dependent sacrificial sulfur transferase LarE [Acidobacteria bacterium]|nr:MAG: ATP-dependent sacrificial sulfur transferase LarE [Acidobacteriota bacterium]REK10336.1 MAG: ATP-dependent sacrificial sulfur transferase LarE [Acidobacteriota bacterium]
MPSLARQLVSDVRRHRGAVVALSGGVDSALVAAIAVKALGERAVAVTVAAETLAGRELDAARRVARQVGIAHRVVVHSELDNPEFVANPRHRCYVCQGMRMDVLRRIAEEAAGRVVLDGTNASDPGPDRPGLAAIRERGVISPLLERGVDKATTRELARRLGLEVWDRPSNACLSSRIPHGQIVTLGKLRRIERAEEVLHSHGFSVVRVRHDGETARVEVGHGELDRARSLWQTLAPQLMECGFAAVALDPEGYRCGGADRREREAALALG